MNAHHLPSQPPVWLARAGADLDAPPLPPRRAARTRRLREIFVHDLGGRATLDEVAVRADQEYLLDGLTTPASALETIAAALRPVATHNVWDSVHRPVWVPHTPIPGVPGV